MVPTICSLIFLDVYHIIIIISNLVDNVPYFFLGLGEDCLFRYCSHIHVTTEDLISADVGVD